MEMEKSIELKHFSHEHPLFFKELHEALSEKIICYGCSKPISGSSYCCFICYELLHKYCAELALEINHPMHTDHPLKLTTVSKRAPSYCDLCNENINGFVYSCSDCHISLDIFCAQEEAHFSKNHPLVLKDFEEIVICYGCKKPITDSSPTSYCEECKFFLHKSCGELALEITHPMHSQHPLKIFSKPPYSSKECTCNVCKNAWSGFTYHCNKCEFDVDVFCAQLEKLFTHSSHNHPLKFQPRSGLLFCDACGTEGKDESYYCTKCSFLIHKNCGLLPKTSEFKRHPHPLSLVYSLPQKYKHYGIDCDICDGKMDPSYWMYCCGPCRYVAHIKCMESKGNLLDDNAAEISPDVLRLPVEFMSSALIEHYLEENGFSQIEHPPKLKHFSHAHALVLFNVQEDYYEMADDDEETVCDACVDPISGSCYHCSQCNFFLHLNCARLPRKISHPFHPQHELFIGKHARFWDYDGCRICGNATNGLFYECKRCKFMVDIKCAFIPTSIKHEAHPHMLVCSESFQNLSCNACSYQEHDLFFSCNDCEYNLSRQCAMLPQAVRHRWDRHPFILSFPPFYYHPDEFMCDFCEEEIHPKFWLYHCRNECDNSFHPDCFPRFERAPKIKFGGTLRINFHPHPLTFSRKARYRSYCGKCGRNLNVSTIYLVFECEPCYYTICHGCVYELWDSSGLQSSPEEQIEIEDYNTEEIEYYNTEESSQIEDSNYEESSQEENSKTEHSESEESKSYEDQSEEIRSDEST